MIEVRACARLHLGLLDNNGEQGRLYGSIGLAVNRPHLVLRAEAADRLLVEGLEADRIAGYAQRFIRRFGLPAGARLNLLSAIPAHVGLGSGTQLALAVGAALSRLADLPLSIQEIALAMGRGMHSGIGIAAFRSGGFVMDGGHRILAGLPGEPKANGAIRRIEDNKVPPVLFQQPVPKDWFFVTIVPKTSQGLNGEREHSAFLQLPEAPSRMVEQISRILLMKMLPALIEKDIANFGLALTDIQCIVGDCFASVQGGRYANPDSEKMISFLLDKGAAGAGQSSWGPVVYGLVEGRSKAQQLKREAQALLKNLGGGQVLCVQPQNRGALIRQI